MINFTYESYEKLLQYIRALGYSIGPLRNFPENGPYVFLRHDIDISVKKALDMAVLERKLGVTSSFFVLLTSPYYNALAWENIQAVKEIAEMGHEVGLHYDCAGFEILNFNEQHSRIAALAECLGSLLGRKIDSISQHRPASSQIRLELPGYIDAYNATFRRGIAYLSDSRMIFSQNDVYGFFHKNARSQLVIHPIWWHPDRKTREEVFSYIRQQLIGQMDETISTYQRLIQEFLKRQDQR